MSGEAFEHLAIINRTTWPQGNVIGEALMSLAATLAVKHRVDVVGQADLESQKMWIDLPVGLYLMNLRAGSSSGLFVRLFDAICFSLWVAWYLVKNRPNRIYVATDPPVVVPFIVAAYCCLFRAKFLYHVQDIHPEIASIFVKDRFFILKLLKMLDNFTLRRACIVLTLTSEMESFLRTREPRASKIILNDNPAVVSQRFSQDKTHQFVFCGNAGRLQLIPELVDGVRVYIRAGGKTSFVFLGSGVYSSLLEELANDYDQVSYLGQVEASEAMHIMAESTCCLLPIESAVSNLAFPSKTSSYLMAECSVLLITTGLSSFGKWLNENSLGLQVGVDSRSIASGLRAMDSLSNETGSERFDGFDFVDRYSIPAFVKNVSRFLLQM